MSNKKLTIKQNVMEQIKKDKVSMKPKAYFMLGTVLTFLGIVFAIITSVFLFSLILFLLKAHGPMAYVRLSQILSGFPWWALALGAISLIFGIIFIRKYDFSYKFNPLVLIVGFIAAVIIAGFLIDITGLDNLWLKRGPMQGIMRQYINSSQSPSDFAPGNQRGNGMRKISQ